MNKRIAMTLVAVVCGPVVVFGQASGGGNRASGAGGAGESRQQQGAGGAGTAGGASGQAGGQAGGQGGGQAGVAPPVDLNQGYQMAGGSLWRMRNGAGGGSGAGSSGGDTFVVRPPDPKRVKKWDLITVIVREESDAKTESTTDLKKSNDFNAQLEQYLKFSLSELALKGRGPLDNQPQLKFGMERNFKGEGTVDRSDSFSARVTAQVIDVKPNGILVIQATKQIKHDEEEQRFTLTGMVRAEDVTLDNSVLSTQLADLNLEKTTKGAARDSSKRGWIPRLMDKLNPF